MLGHLPSDPKQLHKTLSKSHFAKVGTHLSSLLTLCSQNSDYINAAAAVNVDNSHAGERELSPELRETDWSLHHRSHCHFREGDHSNSLVIGFKWIRCRAGQSSSGHRCAIQTQPVVQAVTECEVSIWTIHMRSNCSCSCF